MQVGKLYRTCGGVLVWSPKSRKHVWLPNGSLVVLLSKSRPNTLDRHYVFLADTEIVERRTVLSCFEESFEEVS